MKHKKYQGWVNRQCDVQSRLSVAIKKEWEDPETHTNQYKSVPFVARLTDRLTDQVSCIMEAIW